MTLRKDFFSLSGALLTGGGDAVVRDWDVESGTGKPVRVRPVNWADSIQQLFATIKLVPNFSP
jgi:hypothetical protein